MPKNLLPKFMRHALDNSQDGGQDELKGKYGRQSVKKEFKVVTTNLNFSSGDWVCTNEVLLLAEDNSTTNGSNTRYSIHIYMGPTLRENSLEPKGFRIALPGIWITQR